jgi:hypothetical protein
VTALRGPTAAKFSELQIKALVLGEMRRRGLIDQRTVIANEFRVGHTSVRADLALLAHRFIGVEIKSDFDTLRRLTAQADVGAKCFDRFIIVLTARHLRHLDLDRFPAAEIWLVSEQGKVLQVAKPSVLSSKPDYSKLLTIDESRKYFRPGNGDGALALRRAFSARYGQTSQMFWQVVSKKRIEETSLNVLSRFKATRAHREVTKARLVDQQAQWRTRLENHLAMTG